MNLQEFLNVLAEKGNVRLMVIPIMYLNMNEGHSTGMYPSRIEQ